MATLADALACVGRGLYVFPLPYGKKRPTLDSFPELASNDPLVVASFFDEGVDYNIGVMGGHGFVIVDVDTKYDQKFNRSAYANFISVGGHPDTYAVRTATGGMQFYFRLPVGQHFSSGVNIIPGLDIRCENGYGIGPNSFVIDTEKGVFGGYEVLNDAPIADVPPGILAILKPVQNRKVRLNGHADSEKAIPLYIAYLQTTDPAIDGQGGNRRTYEVACMGVRDYGLTTVTTYNLMMAHYNPRCMPPWEPEDIEKFVENADNYAVGETGSRDPDKLLEKMGGYTVPPQPQLIVPAGMIAGPMPTAGPGDNEPTFDDTDLDDVVGGNIVAPRYIMGKLLQQGAITNVSGPGAVSKSTWLIGAFVHGALGLPYGPYMTKAPFKTLIVNPEDDNSMIRGRIEAACRAIGKTRADIAHNLLVMKSDKKPTLVALDNRRMYVPDGTKRWLDKLLVKHVDLKVINCDPLIKFTHNMPENDNNIMSEAMDLLQQELVRFYDLSFTLVTHMPKGALSGRDVDPASTDLTRGATSIPNSARISINLVPWLKHEQELYGPNTDVFAVHVAKTSYAKRPPATYWLRKGFSLDPSNIDLTFVATVPYDLEGGKNENWSAMATHIGDTMIRMGKVQMSVMSLAQIIAEIKMDYQDEQTSKTREYNIMVRTFRNGSIARDYIDITTGNQYILSMLNEKPKMIDMELKPGTIGGMKWVAPPMDLKGPT